MECRMKNKRIVWKASKEKCLETVIAVLILGCAFALGRETARYTGAMRADVEQSGLCVVIDAGHGGDDPGKIGINGALEKDINLKIAERLKKLLEAQDIRVVMTRETEQGLYDADAPNKKVQDMKRRVDKIREADPVLTVSLHQNSYQQEAIHGAQVFYYKDSTSGKALAEQIQDCLICLADPENHRVVKANDSYYLLKKTSTPIVIVECGFLSNVREAEKLSTEEYQEKIAWAVHMGVLRYLNGPGQ